MRDRLPTVISLLLLTMLVLAAFVLLVARTLRRPNAVRESAVALSVAAESPSDVEQFLQSHATVAAQKPDRGKPPAIGPTP